MEVNGKSGVPIIQITVIVLKHYLFNKFTMFYKYDLRREKLVKYCNRVARWSARDNQDSYSDIYLVYNSKYKEIINI